MTEPKSVALIREALEAGPSPGPWFVADWDDDFGENLTTIEAHEPEVVLPGQSGIWPGGVRCINVASTEDGDKPLIDAAYIAACNPSAIAEVLQHVAALSAQVQDLEADALRYRTWLAYAFSDEEGTETFLIDTPEKMQEWLDKRARGKK